MKRLSWDNTYKKGAHWEALPKDSKRLLPYLKKGNKVLDLGCGSGRDSIFLANQGFKVWGIDISKEAIRKAKGKKNKVNFQVGDATKLSFGDEFFDAVYSGWVLHFIALEKPSREIYRILKKGGIACLGFILNTKIIRTGEVKKYYPKKGILDAYASFKILKIEKISVKDLKGEEPHTHDAIILLLEKV